MNEPAWLDIDIVLDFHAEQLALWAAPTGSVTSGFSNSALARPINKFAYGESDLAVLAAAYGFGIARNHAFVDGNKRTALASMIVFLGLNRIDLDAPPEQATAIILGLAAGRDQRGSIGPLDQRSHKAARCAWDCALTCLSLLSSLLQPGTDQCHPPTPKRTVLRPRGTLCPRRRQRRRRSGALCRATSCWRRPQPRQRSLGARFGAWQSEGSAHEGRPVAGDHSHLLPPEYATELQKLQAKPRPWAGLSSSGA